MKKLTSGFRKIAIPIAFDKRDNVKELIRLQSIEQVFDPSVGAFLWRRLLAASKSLIPALFGKKRGGFLVLPPLAFRFSQLLVTRSQVMVQGSPLAKLKVLNLANVVGLDIASIEVFELANIEVFELANIEVFELANIGCTKTRWIWIHSYVP
jgi:hypothetical protein